MSDKQGVGISAREEGPGGTEGIEGTGGMRGTMGHERPFPICHLTCQS